MEMICDSRRHGFHGVVEVNPVIDEANRTADLAVEFDHVRIGKTNTMRLRVAVLYGGRTGEHEVSIRSAKPS